MSSSSSRPYLTLDIEGEVHPQRRSGFDIGPVLGPMCSIGPVGPVLGPPCGGQGVVVPIWGSAPTSGRPETLGAKLPSIAGKPLLVSPTSSQCLWLLVVDTTCTGTLIQGQHIMLRHSWIRHPCRLPLLVRLLRHAEDTLGEF